MSNEQQYSARALAQAVREIGARARDVLREVEQLAAEIDAAEPAPMRRWSFTTNDFAKSIVATRPDGSEVELRASEIGSVAAFALFNEMATALSAAPAAAAPDGYVLVPREPTHAMLAAVNDWRMDVLVAEDDTAEFPVSQDECERIYSAMIAAAPKPQEQRS